MSYDRRSKYGKATTPPSVEPKAIPTKVAATGVTFTLRFHHGWFLTPIMFLYPRVFRALFPGPPASPV